MIRKYHHLLLMASVIGGFFAVMIGPVFEGQTGT